MPKSLTKIPKSIEWVMDVEQVSENSWKVNVANIAGSSAFAVTASSLTAALNAASLALVATGPVGTGAAFVVYGLGVPVIVDVSEAAGRATTDGVLSLLESDTFVELQNLITSMPEVQEKFDQLNFAYNSWINDPDLPFFGENSGEAILDSLENLSRVHDGFMEDVAENGYVGTFKEYINSTIEGVTSYITNSLTSAYERFKAAISRGLTDPLIIDMGADGLQLKSWEQSGVMFDLNDNGTIEQSGWTTANGNDVFLAIDKNANGNIDDISELFGNATTPGFKELKNFDSNNDNVIDANDSQFGLLKIWNDANHFLTKQVANDNKIAQLKLVA